MPAARVQVPPLPLSVAFLRPSVQSFTLSLWVHHVKTNTHAHTPSHNHHHNRYSIPLALSVVIITAGKSVPLPIIISLLHYRQNQCGCFPSMSTVITDETFHMLDIFTADSINILKDRFYGFSWNITIIHPHDRDTVKSVKNNKGLLCSIVVELLCNMYIVVGI